MSLEADELERQWIGRVAQGDLQAFELLYRDYHPRLWRFLGRTIHRPHLAEEVLNDTMHVVWRKAVSFDGTCKLSTWIFSIAHRTALRALRGSEDPEESDADEELVSNEPGPEDTAIASQQRVLLRRAMEDLTGQQRNVVELAYFHDFGYRDIAEILACPIDTVKTRMFLARRKLKAILDASQEDIA